MSIHRLLFSGSSKRLSLLNRKLVALELPLAVYKLIPLTRDCLDLLYHVSEKLEVSRRKSRFARHRLIHVKPCLHVLACVKQCLCPFTWRFKQRGKHTHKRVFDQIGSNDKNAQDLEHLPVIGLAKMHHEITSRVWLTLKF